jgi:hypothetical protein
MAGRWTRRVLLGLPAALALIVLAAATHIVPPIFGRIVDAVTGEPVRDVVVTLESTRYHGLGSTETVLHSQATTNRWGWFWLMPTIGWSQSLALVVPTMGGPWMTINQIPVDGSGSFAAAEVSALFDPTSKREGMKVSNPSYFPLTVAYDPRQTCGQWQAWFATCVDGRSWWNVAIPLTPVLDTANRCTSIRESVAQDRCRQLNTYRAAFRHVDTFDDVQQDLALCDQLPDRIRAICRMQLGVYVANPKAYGRSALPADAEPRVAQYFPATIAGENRTAVTCDTAAFTSGHLNCRAKYGEGPYGLVMVTIEEWAGREEPPLERRELLTSKPPYIDAAQGVAASETRREATIRMFHGPKVTAADWISRNRYVRVYSEQRTEKQNAFIESFLRRFPSTLH